MRPALNNRVVKEAIDQIIKNASIIGSIIHRIDQMGNPASRYEVIDISHMSNEIPKMPPCIAIRLSRQEYEKLLDCLIEHEDSGPSGSGWKSRELELLIDLIRRQGEGVEKK